MTIIKVIKFGDKIFNRTKVINKNMEGEVILPPPPSKIGLMKRQSSVNDSNVPKEHVKNN